MRGKNIFHISICLLISALIFTAFPAWGADYYIAQSAAGSGDGSSCGNARAVTWNWTSPTVAAGDTVHLCGTFTSTLTIPRSGSPGAPITVKFESGAKFAKPYWGPSYGDNAIYSDGKSYITIDGDNVGIIENTDNGYGKTYKTSYTGGMFINHGNYIEVKNLTVRNIWIAAYHDTVSSNQRNNGGIAIWNSSNVSIHHNTIHDAAVLISMVYTDAGSYSNVSVHHNTMYNCNWGLNIASGAASAVNLSNVSIYNNDIGLSSNWEDFPAQNNNHHNGIYMWNYSPGVFNTIAVYNNYIHWLPGAPGAWPQTTSGMWLESNITNIKIYNNLLVADSLAGPSNGAIQVSIGETSNWTQIYNNTIIGVQGPPWYSARCISYSSGGAGRPIISNNIMVGCNSGMYFWDRALDVPAGDNNLFYKNNYDYYFKTSTPTLARWKTSQGCSGGSPANKDCNSKSANPKFNADYTLQSISPAKWAGKSSGQLSPTDKAGVTWYNPPSIGAYEYGSVRK